MLVGWWCICCCSGEMVEHFLLHVSVLSKMWSFIFWSFGFYWVLSARVIDLLFGWWNWVGKHSSDIWNIVPVPLCLMWALLREWNPCTFEDMENSGIQLIAFFNSCLIAVTSPNNQLQFVSSIFLSLFLQ